MKANIQLVTRCSKYHSCFQCTVSGECIDLAKTCNGVNDCSDSSDEVMPQCNDLIDNLPKNGPHPSNNNSATSGSSSNLTTYLISFFVLILCLILAVSVTVYCRKKAKDVKNNNPDSRYLFLVQPLL